jgi:formylglycine-generating enzyme required for sulfatase activity/serine/threonine protein phosphatase PrpC
MSLSFEIAGAQIDGAREYQEDAFLITNLTDQDGKPSALVIVADGMGGHAAGNVASNMAVQAFNKHVTANYPSEHLHEVLNGAVLKANHSIAETVKETPALDGMGCTMVGVLLQGNKIWWASVGDSHLYLIRNRELSKINADHSYGGFLDAMEAAGTPVEPEPGLSRNMLMSAVTGSDISEIDCPTTPLQLQEGDKILISSDGLDTLSEGKIIQYCDWSDAPKDCADALLNAVEEADMPKQDNTTVVVINAIDKAAAAAAAAVEVEDEDEDEDITDTSGQARAATKVDLDKTADIFTEDADKAAIEESLAEPETAAPAAGIETEAAGAVAEKPATEGAHKGLIFGIAAGVVIVVGIAGFFLFGGEQPVTTETMETTTTVTDEAETPIETEAATETEIAAEPVSTAEQPDVEPEITAAEPEQKAEEKPAKAAAQPVVKIEKKEFSDPLKSGGKGPMMVLLPATTFEMGSPSSSIQADERPQHTVTLKQFAISKYEITFSEYDQFANATGRKLPDNLYMDRDTSPVIFVSWDDAYNYAKWLTEQTGHKYRLPSEAEWEYAASGGQQASFWWGFNEEPGKAHCLTCDSLFDPRKPAKIGSFEPNQFGLYDTAGNVAEWVQDCWHENYKEAPDDGSVWEGGDCTQRTVRGGSFISPQQSIRITKRDKFRSDSGYDHVGIRMVREVK